MFDMIKSFYQMGLYTKSDLDLFVSVGYITNEQEQSLLGTNIETAAK